MSDYDATEDPTVPLESTGSASPLSANLLQRRLLHAQKNIDFLQDQHKQTLNELHAEIDRLKLQNKDQQWKLVLAGASSVTSLERRHADFAQQTADTAQADRDFRIKVLEEENLDLKARVECLSKANEKLKGELVNRAKGEKLAETKRYHDTKYRSKYQKRDINTKILPLITGATHRVGGDNNEELHVHFPAPPPHRPAQATEFHLPQLRGVNQTIKHNRRLGALNQRYQY